ncbi:hypothetical protein SARC_07796 [Sphaeroforma arctica JP610]|uniref:Uncharacterized protein n=1 Tax=Sphaeroforma arctica JP610 TaxID=667725 RepID=A0A0L0FSR6_9EUKA|nr:hypothetical protein SARC_07796 [Sphaeroforma arctica JP610]KNC79825.1 hypothetical protein SARC_07796 [Sphaeroforma arctica JP610]|eukprot:XP_014153727.1 hypothetical protein SARC_07796 [Sphaeroforma arctica JP610]
MSHLQQSTLTHFSDVWDITRYSQHASRSNTFLQLPLRVQNYDGQTVVFPVPNGCYDRVRITSLTDSLVGESLKLANIVSSRVCNACAVEVSPTPTPSPSAEATSTMHSSETESSTNPSWWDEFEKYDKPKKSKKSKKKKKKHPHHDDVNDDDDNDDGLVKWHNANENSVDEAQRTGQNILSAGPDQSADQANGDDAVEEFELIFLESLDNTAYAATKGLGYNVNGFDVGGESKTKLQRQLL